MLQTGLSFVDRNFPEIDGIILNYIASYSHELALRSALQVSFHPRLVGLLSRFRLSTSKGRHLGNVPSHEVLSFNFNLAKSAFYETNLTSLAFLFVRG